MGYSKAMMYAMYILVGKGFDPDLVCDYIETTQEKGLPLALHELVAAFEQHVAKLRS